MGRTKSPGNSLHSLRLPSLPMFFPSRSTVKTEKWEEGKEEEEEEEAGGKAARREQRWKEEKESSDGFQP